MAWTVWILLGSVAGALGVAFGAFGAHGLRTRVSPEDLAIFEVGVRYQMYHALALLAVGFLALRVDTLAVRIAGVAFAAGIVVFSGTLYAMTFGAPRWFGAITPLGGLALIGGWVAMAVSVATVAR